MASTITAGNATNGLAIASDNVGIFQLKTGTGAGTTALTIDASQNATFAGTVTSTGVITSPTGALYPISTGTAVASTSGTSILFTGIPSTAKRVTVMFSGVSTSGTSQIIVQLGTSSGLVTSGYLGSSARDGNPALVTAGLPTSNHTSATDVRNGAVYISSFGANQWISISSIGLSSTGSTGSGGGNITLSGVLDRVNITTVNGTDTFRVGTVNILWE